MESNPPIVVYYGVKLIDDLDWDHGEPVEAVYNTQTGRLDFQEWLDEAQVVNQKTVFVDPVKPFPGYMDLQEYAECVLSPWYFPIGAPPADPEFLWDALTEDQRRAFREQHQKGHSQEQGAPQPTA